MPLHMKAVSSPGLDAVGVNVAPHFRVDKYYLYSCKAPLDSLLDPLHAIVQDVQFGQPKCEDIQAFD
eukprot:4923911-Amphidinium_carterae.1